MPDLGSAKFTLYSDSRPFEAGMTGAEAKANTTTKSIGTKVSGLANGMSKAGHSLTKFITLPVIGVGAASVDMAAKFQESMHKLITGVGLSESQVEKLQKGVLKLSGQTAVAPKDLADALFYVTSAGLRGKQALDVLGNSAKLSAIGLGTAKDNALVLTSSVNAFKGQALTAGQAAATLYDTVKQGELDPATLATSLSKVSPIAGAMGVKFQDLGASIAAMTRLGYHASDATTALRGVMSGLLKPTAAAQATAKKLGLSFGDMRKEVKDKGLVALMSTLKDKTHGNTVEMSSLFGNVRALGGILALTGGKGLKTYTQIQAQMGHGTKEVNEEFKKAQESAEFKFHKALNTLRIDMIQLGQKLLPIVIKVVELFQKKLAQVVAWYKKLSPAQQDIVKKVILFAAALGPTLILLAKLIKVGKAVVGLAKDIAKGVEYIGKAFWNVGKAMADFVVKSAKVVWSLLQQGATIVKNIAAWLAQKVAMIASAVASGILTAATAALDFVMDANPIMLVVIAIIALVAIFVIAYKKVGWFRNFVNSSFDAIKSAITTAMHKAGAAITYVWNWVKQNWPILLGVLVGPIGLAVGEIIQHWGKIQSAIQNLWNWITNNMSNIWGDLTGGLTGAIGGIVSTITGGIESAINGAIDIMNRGLNIIHDHWPDVPGAPGPPFGHNPIPHVQLAMGGFLGPGRTALVGERGPELITLGGRGARVSSAHDTSNMLARAGNGGGLVVGRLKIIDWDEGMAEIDGRIVNALDMRDAYNGIG